MEEETLKHDFEQAAQEVLTLKSRPDNGTLLKLYALYKQATEGDAKGSRPRILDVKGRAKHDAWVIKRGLSNEAAMKEYIELVRKVVGR